MALSLVGDYGGSGSSSEEEEEEEEEKETEEQLKPAKLQVCTTVVPATGRQTMSLFASYACSLSSSIPFSRRPSTILCVYNISGAARYWRYSNAVVVRVVL